MVEIYKLTRIAIVSVLCLATLFWAVGMVPRRCLPQSIAVCNLAWETKSNSTFGISFEMPSDWRMEDRRFTVSGTQDNLDHTYDEFSLCPPKADQVGARGGLHDSCITFYDKKRILNPPNYVLEGPEDIFDEFKPYIAGRGVGVLRVFRALNRQYQESDGDLTVDLEGFYLHGVSDIIGMHQLLCRKDLDEECTVIFQHILKSLIFRSA